MTSINSPAFVFPAFINEYPADPFGGSAQLKETFTLLLSRAESLVPGISDFGFTANPFPEDELLTQLFTFIYSCSAGELPEGKNISPAFSAGYSMGLYAALVHSGAVTFEEGLMLIRTAYETIRQFIPENRFGMCSVIGLSGEDIENLVESGNLNLRIVNRNSPFAYVLSGKAKSIEQFRELALAEGALNLHLLNVSVPYHSCYLEDTKPGFSRFVHLINIRRPENRIISLIDQKILSDEGDIREELIRNLYTPLNWYQTQLRLMELGVKTFVEMGPGKSLVKNAKFIEGDYRFLSLSDYIKQP